MIPSSEVLRIAETNEARACGLAFVGAITGCADVHRRSFRKDTLWIDVPALHGRLSDVQGLAIRKSLEMANGNKSKAAKFLGIGRATLYRKLKDPG